MLHAKRFFRLPWNGQLQFLSFDEFDSLKWILKSAQNKKLAREMVRKVDLYKLKWQNMHSAIDFLGFFIGLSCIYLFQNTEHNADTGIENERKHTHT